MLGKIRHYPLESWVVLGMRLEALGKEFRPGRGDEETDGE
jgi:hypothetical protein